MTVGASLADLRNAVVDLADADAVIQGITGRTELNLIPRQSLKFVPNRPIATYSMIQAPEALGTDGRADVLIQFDVWYEPGMTTMTEAETFRERLHALFIGPSLATQGVDAAVNPIAQRRDGIEEAELRSLQLDVRFDLTT